MKIYCFLFLGVLSNPSKRDAEEIECPARCWEKSYNSDTNLYECVPEAGKVSFSNCPAKKKPKFHLKKPKICTNFQLRSKNFGLN